MKTRLFYILTLAILALSSCKKDDLNQGDLKDNNETDEDTLLVEEPYDTTARTIIIDVSNEGGNSNVLYQTSKLVYINGVSHPFNEGNHLVLNAKEGDAITFVMFITIPGNGFDYNDKIRLSLKNIKLNGEVVVDMYNWYFNDCDCSGPNYTWEITRNMTAI